MSLKISEVRRTLFALAEAASRGERVEFTHKEKNVYIVAEEKPDKLSRLRPMAILTPGTTIEDVDQALKEASGQAGAVWELRQSS